MASAAPDSLSTHLRVHTAEAHAALEAHLDLLALPLEEDRFRRVLQGFHGFHRVMEPALARHPAGAWLTPRLAALHDDLRALGLSDAGIDALPQPAGAAAIAEDPHGAWGAAYVLEGSTLGGRVIARALADCAWAPEGGLRYFDPHGAATGARWRDFRRALDAAGPPSDWPAVTQGARGAFHALADWLRPAPAATVSGEPP